MLNAIKKGRKGRNGFTLVELMVALGISSLLLTSIYTVFISQEKTYAVQDQVADTQQTLRVSTALLIKEMRMAGYGAPAATNVVNVTDAAVVFQEGNRQVNADSITLIGCVRAAPTRLSADAKQGTGTITVSDASSFAVGDNIVIGGIENVVINAIAGNQLTLNSNLQNSYLTNMNINLLRTVTYAIVIDDPPARPNPRLTRAENGGAAQPFVENIEDLQITPTTANQSSYTVTLTATTDREDRQNYVDPNFGDGFRRKTLSSNIKIRNLSIQNQGF